MTLVCGVTFYTSMIYWHTLMRRKAFHSCVKVWIHLFSAFYGIMLTCYYGFIHFWLVNIFSSFSCRIMRLCSLNLHLTGPLLQAASLGGLVLRCTGFIYLSDIPLFPPSLRLTRVCSIAAFSVWHRWVCVCNLAGFAPKKPKARDSSVSVQPSTGNVRFKCKIVHSKSTRV